MEQNKIKKSFLHTDTREEAKVCIRKIKKKTNRKFGRVNKKNSL